MDADKVGNVVDSQCNEFFDGHIVIGFVANTGIPVIRSRAADPKTSLALNSLLLQLLQAGGVGVTSDEPKPNS